MRARVTKRGLVLEWSTLQARRDARPRHDARSGSALARRRQAPHARPRRPAPEPGAQAGVGGERAVDAAVGERRTYGSVACVSASVAVRATSAGMFGTRSARRLLDVGRVPTAWSCARSRRCRPGRCRRRRRREPGRIDASMRARDAASARASGLEHGADRRGRRRAPPRASAVGASAARGRVATPAASERSQRVEPRRAAREHASPTRPGRPRARGLARRRCRRR